MKHMLNLYLLGVALTLLCIFVSLIESLGSLLGSPLPGSPCNHQRSNSQHRASKRLPEHPSRGM
nr:PREDICTED: hypoxia-inducible lipid droplet-associated protein [Camelus bactrianus]